MNDQERCLDGIFRDDAVELQNVAHALKKWSGPFAGFVQSMWRKVREKFQGDTPWRKKQVFIERWRDEMQKRIDAIGEFEDLSIEDDLEEIEKQQLENLTELALLAQIGSYHIGDLGALKEEDIKKAFRTEDERRG